MEASSFFGRLNEWAKNSVVVKLITIGILTLLLLIPSAMISSLIYERQSIRDGVISEVSSKWGDKQNIGGPVISIPYVYSKANEKGIIEYFTSYVHFLPDELKITGQIIPEKRYRGIYIVVLYNVILNIEGSFDKLNYQALEIPKEQLLLNKAFISIGIKDMKGIKENINCSINDSVYAFGPGIPNHDIFNSGASFPINIKETEKFSFKLNLNLNGNSDLTFAPFGKETYVSLTSTWKDPAFIGSFLPDERKINSAGFSASWKVLQLNRNYPQQGKGKFINIEEYIDNTANFGVQLLLPVDEYQKTMRSAKYNIIFILITFLVFFFSEVLKKNLIHPIQYLLVGFSITLFYVLLLAFSEHVLFNWAYLWSSIIIIILITFYSRSIFKNYSMAAMVSGVLSILYIFFYSILQLEDYALLMGSLGLLLILGSIMYLTRNIDWYSIKRNRT